jgi:DNA-binding CsgD family transcriptional regulator
VQADQWAADDEAAAVLDELAPDAIINSVVARLGAMSAAAGALATAVAVLGDRVALGDAARLAELDLADAYEAADALAAVQILHPGVPLSFAQPMIRTAVLAAMPPFARGSAHRRAASILHDPVATEDLRLAARDTIGFGEPEIAARLLERALDEQPPPEVYADVLAELGQAEALAGLPQAPERLGDAIEIINEPARRSKLVLAQGQALIAQGAYRDAAALLELGLRELGGAEQTRDRSVTEGRLVDELDCAYVVAAAFVPEHVKDALRRRESILGRIGGRPSRAQRAAIAATVLQDGIRGADRASIRRLVDLVWEDPMLADPDTPDELSFTALTSALLFADELERELQLCDAALAAVPDSELPRTSPTVSHSRLWPTLERGQIADALVDARSALDASCGTHHIRAAYGALAYCHLFSGELDSAEHALAIIEDRDLTGTPRHAFLLGVRAELRLAQHRPKDALRDALTAGYELEAYAGAVSPGVLPWRSSAALAHLALGDPAKAEPLASEELDAAERAGITRVVVRNLRVLGLVAGGTRGIELLERAVALGERYPPRLETTCAQLSLGSALRRAKKRAAAREPLRRAFEFAQANGAAALAQRAQGELAASGVRSVRMLMRGIDALTPSENRVAELAAQGKTTRQIADTLVVAPKTVEFHLRHIYRKLDVNSRSQLTKLLADSGGSDRSEAA